MPTCCISNLMVMLMVTFQEAQAGQIYQRLYKVTLGYKLSQGTVLLNVSFQTITLSYCVLLCHIGCGSATFSLKNKVCITFMEKFYNFNVQWTIDPDWITLYRDEPVQYGVWTLVFRGQTSINTSMSAVWNATGHHDDNPLSSDTLNGCYRMDNLGGCKKHFRSHILDNWTNIRQVRFSVYINSNEKKYTVFDGTSTTSVSWFNQSRVLYSTWYGIRTDASVTFFRIFGYPTKQFVISNNDSQCDGYKSYFTAIDHPSDPCEVTWHLSITTYPVLLFSNYDGMAAFYTSPPGFEYADKIAVYVTY